MKIIVRLLILFAIVFIAIIILGYVFKLNWVGVVNHDSSIKTLWDWMELLIIPAVLAFGGWFLASSERRAEIEKTKIQKDNELQIVLEKQQQDSLQTYLDYMTALILDRNLRSATSESDIASIAAARTHATLRMLDGVRKGIVIRFLVEVGLIINTEIVDEKIVACSPVLNLEGADLSNMKLTDLNFWQGVVFHRSNLSNAIFERTGFSRSSFWGSKIDKADFSTCELIGANFAHVNMSNTNFSHTNASEIVFGLATIKNSDFKNSILLEGMFDKANLENVLFSKSWFCGANFTGSTLNEVSFEGADLSPWYENEIKKVSTFSSAKLNSVNFNGADLTEVDFRYATVSLDLLSKAKSLKGAIMPNGEVHP